MTPPERSQTFDHPSSSSTLHADGTYWLDKLAPFGHPPRFLPCGLTPEGRDSVTVHAICRAADAAVPMDVVGLAGFALVASRYNGSEPLVIASAADRPAALRCVTVDRLDEQEHVHAYLGRMRAQVEEARRHEPWILEVLAGRLGLDAATQDRGLLQLAYGFGPEAPMASLREQAGIFLRIEHVDQDLHLELSAKGTAYPATLLPQLVAHIARAIAWLTERGDAQLRDCELLSAAERRQLATAFNDTRVPVPAGLTLHGLVATQAARTPAKTALIYRDTSVTYQSLDRQANHLAAMLRRDFRVAAGSCVGVMMERSDKTVVALYGVMKAGAAYVPINPRHPWETVRYMIENAGISVLIVDSESIASAASFAGELLVIDVELAGSPEAADPGTTVSGSDLAYVIYTSGSTGKPKGVAVEHRAIANTILWRNAFYGIGPADINLQIPSFAFDSSVVDIFCVLTAGGTLVVPDESMRLDARRLLELSVRHAVTSCIVTPSYYRLLVGELAGAVPSLQWVTLAGESATPQLVAAHLDKLPAVGLYNEYGPTENAVCSTACRLETSEATVSIGKPIWNVSVLILDAAGRLSPIGVPGEMYLGGDGLARGYLNQPALTEERFVPSPVPEFCAGRLYKTGDRACWRPDGSLEFLGRFDSQVKIRGFRIELDEVEQAVCRHPQVKSAAVICKEDSSGAKYLAAYIEGHVAATRHQLREHMAQQVPQYMIPDAFTILPQLPLNLNGKVDRAALADIDDFRSNAAAGAAALSPVQSTLVELWADVLKRRPIALDDNFFAMGGNSLRVMELTSRIRGELSPGVELLDIYTYPTVRELADRLAPTE